MYDTCSVREVLDKFDSSEKLRLGDVFSRALNASMSSLER